MTIRYANQNPIVTRQAMEFAQNDNLFFGVRNVPLVKVDAPSGKLAIVNQDTVNIDDIKVRAFQHTEAEKGSIDFKYVDYETDSRALEFDISAAIERQISREIGTNLNLTVPRVLARKANIHIEGLFGKNVWDPAKWYRVVTGAGADSGAEGTTAMNRKYWSDPTVDPIAAIVAEKRIFLVRNGLEPTDFRMGYELFETVSGHPLVRGQVALLVGGNNVMAGQTLRATEAQLSQLTGMRVSRGGGIKNTAAQGLPSVNAFILDPKDALMTFDAEGTFSASPRDDGGPPVVDFGSPTGLARLAWTGLAPDGFLVRSFPRPEIGAGGSQAHVLDLTQGFLIVDNKLGTYFDNLKQ